MLRKGFALLEMLLAMAVSSILMVLWLQTTGQMSGMFQRVSAVSEIDRNLVTMIQQFERDFIGVFSPQITLKTEVKRSEVEEKEEQKVKTTTKKDTQKIKKETTTLPFAFFSKNDGKGNCIELTCITSNPLVSYQQTIPYLARIVYRLMPDPEQSEAFLLARQQSEKLDYKFFSKESENPVRSYTVATGIKSLKIEFLIPKVEKDEDKKEKDTKDSKEDKKREFITLQEWKELEEDEEKKEKRPLIPSFIHITMTLIDLQKRTTMFELWFAPLYDAQSVTVSDITTLPSTHEIYHRKFAEHKAREQSELMQSWQDKRKEGGK
jgi:prepilin-type N-terminal cleavage/methylation domain-containing protein